MRMSSGVRFVAMIFSAGPCNHLNPRRLRRPDVSRGLLIDETGHPLEQPSVELIAIPFAAKAPNRSRTPKMLLPRN
jgi:hypothetical protein